METKLDMTGCKHTPTVAVLSRTNSNYAANTWYASDLESRVRRGRLLDLVVPLDGLSWFIRLILLFNLLRGDLARELLVLSLTN